MERRAGRLIAVGTATLIGGIALAIAFASRPGREGGRPPEELAERFRPVGLGGDSAPAAAGMAGETALRAAESAWLVVGRAVRRIPGIENGKAPPSGPTAEPVGGARVRLRGTDRAVDDEDETVSHLGETSTGPDGRFSYPVRKGPTGWLLVDVDDGECGLETLAFSCEDRDRNAPFDVGDILLRPGSTLQVNLTDSGGRPITRARVAVSREWHGRTAGNPPPPRDLGDGAWAVERIVSGIYVVRVEARGHVSAMSTVEVPRVEPLLICLREGARIAGVVRDPEGRPIAGALVEINRGSGVRTDAGGRFSFEDLGEGEAGVTAKAAGFIPNEEVIPAGREDAVLVLERALTITGLLVGARDRRPVAEAEVFLEPGPNQEMLAKSDGRGAFTLDGLAAGLHRIGVSHRNFLPWKGEARAVSPERIDLGTIRLEPGRGISGRVLDAATGGPISGAGVGISIGNDLEDWTRNRETRSGKDGTFSLGSLQFEAGTLSAGAYGYLSVRRPIGPASVEGLVLSLERDPSFRNVSISGRIVDMQGLPVWRAEVRSSAIIGTARSDAEGRFRFDGLCDRENYGLWIRHPDGWVEGPEIRGGGAIGGLEIRLLRGATVRGRLVDEKGEGVRGYVHDEKRCFAAVNDDGRYLLPRLLPGRHVLEAGRGGLNLLREITVEEGERVEGIEFILPLGESLSLVGRVLDPEGAPIADAWIGTGSNDTQTGPDGSFRLNRLSTGRLTLKVWREGFEGREVEFHVPAGEITVTLERRGRISGRVRAEGVETFDELLLFARDSVRRYGDRRIKTNFDGSFEGWLPEGSWSLRAEAKGFLGRRSETIEVRGGHSIGDLTLDLSPVGAIDVLVVLAASGKPVSDTKGRFLHSASDEYWQNLETAADGTFSIEGIAGGTYWLEVALWDHRKTKVEGIAVRPGERTAVRVEVPVGGRITGRVRRGGENIPRIDVTVRGDGTFSNTWTDEQGAFSFEGLEAGEYEVLVEGLGENPRMVTVGPGGAAEVDFDLGSSPTPTRGAARITGRVLLGGQPVAGAVVTSRQSKQVTDASGRYSVKVPEPGFHQFHAGHTRVQVKVLRGEEEVVRDIELGTGEIAGTVIDGATGRPVRDARVIVLPGGTPSLHSRAEFYTAQVDQGKVDDSGRFAFLGIPPGTYSVHATAPGHAPAWIGNLEPAPEGATRKLSGFERKIALRPWPPVQLRAVDPTGRPIAGASLIGPAWLLSWQEWGKRSGADGRLEVDGLGPDFTFYLTARGRAPARFSAGPEPGGEREVVLGPGGFVEVQVIRRRRATGRPRFDRGDR
jgi:protocatechuate 3,4-dioxygenase beta subunit